MIEIARFFYKSATILYRVSDWSGESNWTLWMQRPLDIISIRLDSLSAKLLVKNYEAIWDDQTDNGS